MGMDISGINPTTERGEYFRNNVWWWRPLWQYMSIVCGDILTEEDIKRGSYNDGYQYSAEKTKRITERLDLALANGSVKKYEEDYKKELNDLPLEECNICKGTGWRDDSVVKGKCNACGGIGKKDDWAKSYPFSEENVIEFNHFLKESGGFEIW